MKALRGLFASQWFRQVTIGQAHSRRIVLEPVSLAQLHDRERALASKALFRVTSTNARRVEWPPSGSKADSAESITFRVRTRADISSARIRTRANRI